jgi:hypothetical protein
MQQDVLAGRLQCVGVKGAVDVLQELQDKVRVALEDGQLDVLCYGCHKLQDVLVQRSLDKVRLQACAKLTACCARQATTDIWLRFSARGYSKCYLARQCGVVSTGQQLCA